MRDTLRRTTDRLLAAAILAISIPNILLIALLIRLTSPGPVLFRQLRYDFNGKPIQVLRFRTMYVDACGTPRPTYIGQSLRRFRIDELPQLLNVLKGDMRLVDRRPPLPGPWGSPAISPKKERASVSFSLRFMNIAELLIPQTIAEQHIGCQLEHYERRRPQDGNPWDEFWADWWLVKETVYSLGPIVSGRLSKLILVLLGYLGYRHAADLLAKLIGR
jgi:hypothetical protein